MDIPHDLDRLASELELLASARPRGGSKLEEWLRLVADRQASDLLLVAGEPPYLRIHGRMERSGPRI